MTPNRDDCFDELIRELRAEGYTDTAGRLDELLHHTAWSSSSELLGELGLEILAFSRVAPNLKPKLKEVLKRALSEIQKNWPGIK